jgi:hypothetical protein
MEVSDQVPGRRLIFLLLCRAVVAGVLVLITIVTLAVWGAILQVGLGRICRAHKLARREAVLEETAAAQERLFLKCSRIR